MHIVLSALEASADCLMADFMGRFRASFPHVRWSGIGGPRMQEQGLRSVYPVTGLDKMGITSVLSALPRFYRARTALLRAALAPDVAAFMGCDAPDFHLAVERYVKRSGVRVAHAVSPSVWAWRAGRIDTVAQACHHLFTLFPFEQSYYTRCLSGHFSVSCIGYPPLHNLPWQLPQVLAKAQCGFQAETTRPLWLWLPGSRLQELQLLVPVLAQTARLLREKYGQEGELVPQIAWAVEAPWQKAYILGQLRTLGVDAAQTPIVLGNTPAAIRAADAVLACSGTVTLQAALLERPLITVYKTSTLTYALARLLLRTPYLSLPNILTNRALIPEYIQGQCTPENLAKGWAGWWDNSDLRAEQCSQFVQLRESLSEPTGHFVSDFASRVLQIPPICASGE